MNDESSAGSYSGDVSQLSASQLKTHDELLRIDSQLAALYLAGHGLARQEGSAHVYLLAHAGRELSRGVISALAGTLDDLARERSDDRLIEKDHGEKNRTRIAKALELPERHGTVARWFDAVDECASNSHWSPTGRDLARARTAFLQLSELLFGRLAPFFDASAELARLSVLPAPTAEDADAVTRLLLRPQLRRQFFASAISPLWISALNAAKAFVHVPNRLIEADGSWRMQSWPEGDFLARMAALAPEIAVPLLLDIPRDNTNPAAWGVLVDAAMHAGEPYAEQLTRRVVKGLRTVPPVYLPHKSVDLLVELARRKRPYSVALLEALLWLRSTADRDERLAAHENVLPWSGRSTEWVLARLDLYELQRLLEHVVPLLVDIDPDRLLAIAINHLDRALYLLRGADEEGSDWVFSHVSCPDLESADDRDDVRAAFVWFVSTVAVAFARRSDEEAVAVCEQLATKTGVIWERIHWHVVSQVGATVPRIAESIIGSDALLESPFGFREAGRILRECFGLVSDDSRSRFVAALEAGPAAERLSQLVQTDLEWASTEAEPIDLAERAADIKARWLRQRLTLFRDDLPGELEELSRSVNDESDRSGSEQPALDDVFLVHGGVSSWGGPPSPKAPEEMASLAPEELAKFLAEWAPSDPLNYGPNERWALNQAVTTFATNNPASAVAVLRAGLEVGLPLRFGSTLIDGLREACKSKVPISWTDCMTVLKAYATRSAVRAADATTRDHVQDVQLLRAVVGVMTAACNNDFYPVENRDQLFDVVRLVLSSDLVALDAIPTSQRWREIVSKSLNSLAGDLVRMVVNVGFWEYRHRNGGDGNGSGNWVGPDTTVAEVVEPWLNALLNASTQLDDAFVITVALSLESLRLLAPAWVRGRQPQLISSEAEQVNPAARAVLQSGPRRASIADFREALKQHAVLAATLTRERDSNDSEDAVSASVLWWGVLGFLWNVWSVNEHDEIMEACFEASTDKERSHVYWRLFRELSDSSAPDPVFVKRVEELWRWRLTKLSGTPEAHDAEAEGLLWMLKAPGLDPAATVELGIATLSLGPFSDRLATGAWERIGELMTKVPEQAFGLLVRLVELQLESAYAYVPFEQVAPAIRAALHSDVLGLSARDHAGAPAGREGASRVRTAATRVRKTRRGDQRSRPAALPVRT